MSAVEALPFPVFRDRLLSLYAPPLRARSTFLGMRHAVDLFGALPGVATTLDLTSDRLAAYIAARSGAGIATNTTISELSYLRAAANLAIDEGWLERNPFKSRRLRLRREPSPRRSHYAIADVARLLAGLDARRETWRGRRLHALASTVAYTGLRKNEALFLQLADVDLAARVLVISPRRRLKTSDSAGLVPIPPELVPVLGRWLPDAGPDWLFPGSRRLGPWTGGVHGYRPLDCLKAAGEEFGLPGLTFHSLRHTLATHMASAWGLSVEQIRQVLRHSRDSTTLAHYVHRDMTNLLKGVERVSYRPAS